MRQLLFRHSVSCQMAKEAFQKEGFKTGEGIFISLHCLNFLLLNKNFRYAPCIPVLHMPIQKGNVLCHIAVIVASVCIACHQSIFLIYFRSLRYCRWFCSSFNITAGFIVKSNFMAGGQASTVSEDECCVSMWLWWAGRHSQEQCRSFWVYQRNRGD